MSTTPRIAGIDLGKAAAKVVVASISSRAPRGLTVDAAEVIAHDGRPLEAFCDLYRRLDLAGCAALGITGLHADAVVAPALSSLPEDACLEAGLGLRPELDGPLNVVSVGARGYAVLARDASGRVQYVENDKCSSGTGETMIKTAARFGLELAQADRAARGATGAIPITARCSVFAKSEMTHYGNQGEPVDRLFRGYFESVARYVAALVARVRVRGPVILVGGGSRLGTLRDCLEAQLECEVRVPDEALFFEALGAAALAADHVRSAAMRALPPSPDALLRPKRRRIETLEPAHRWSSRVARLEAIPVPEGAAEAPCILGLDLGSTGSKAVLTSIETGEMVFDAYDRTRGNPVEAAQRLVRSVLGRVRADVRAVGVTGSGREAVATVLRAALGESEERVVVQNEIVAHATAAIRCDEENGKSLSVIEIGGQDAKFIQIAGGHIVESDMNKACSAGTGSFLEEQAALYGVHDIEEFTRLAQQSTSPPDLGQMCTVFVADAAAEAHAEGFSIADLFAGFQYSVIHNYLNRVMGQRSLGARVFFQGKPATGPSLAWTLAAVSGRDVVVPPNPGAMGAWGIGLLARSELGSELLMQAPSLDLGRVLDARVVAKSDFHCEDKRCATLCRIERAMVDVGGARQTVLSGGACPKFEIAAAGKKHKLPRDAPSAFDERQALLEPYLEASRGSRVIGVPEAGSLVGWLPWAVTLLRELGLGVRVLRADAKTLSRGEELCYAYDACAPTKVAHGIVRGEVDALFFPRLLDIGDRDGSPGRTCASEQAMPLLVERALRARGLDVDVVMPAISLASRVVTPALLLELANAARRLGADPARVGAAAHRAAEAQASYERELAAIGRRTLAYGRAREIPIVLVCGALHVLFDRTINAGIPNILRQNGTLPLPADCYPVPERVDRLDRIEWADARRALRASLAAREAGDLYPLLLTAFGCGPASFVEQIFDSLMRDYPHTILESDGHGGTAGFVTRIQSFLHGVRQYGRRPSPAPARRLALLQPIEPRPLQEERDSRLITFPVADRLGALVAAALRSLGYDAVAAGPNTPETFALGRRDCSGKECLPYQLVWGAFRKELEDGSTGKRKVLVQSSGQGACRNCMFSIKDRISIEHLGLGDRADIRHFGAENDGRAAFMTRFWGATLAWDVLYQLASYHRAADGDRGRVDAIHTHYQDALAALVEEPQARGVRSLLGAPKYWNRMIDLVELASREFAGIDGEGRHDGLRTVLLSGDIYVRLDEFANDGLIRALGDRGLRVLVEPANVFVQYLNVERSAELLGLPTGLVECAVNGALMRRMRRAMYERVRLLHPWLPMPDVRDMLRAGRPVLDRHPLGEAPVTVGSVLHAWQSGICDGVVLASPWGCGPALLSEGLLRHEREIPMLFLYCDGSPMDERRLSAFASRIHRSAPRAAPRAAARAPRGAAGSAAPRPSH